MLCDDLINSCEGEKFLMYLLFNYFLEDCVMDFKSVCVGGYEGDWKY